MEIFNRKHSKPEFNKALNHLSISDVDYIYIKGPKYTKELLTNYIQATKSFKKNNFIILNRDEAITKNNLWQICYQPRNNFDCSLDNKFKNVVFPEPLFPINPILSDLFIWREIFLKITLPAKSKLKLFNLINFSLFPV